MFLSTLIDITIVEDKILELMDWAEDGGHVLFAIGDLTHQTRLTGIYRRLGMTSMG